ncbi:hypothetical protein [Pedobacter sp.]|jgi:hypothetical protein|uniref:hypothetical protein n=1 Tax=Pedobacter sp. TaxID=1411316 RepID=UPI002BDD0432|nr:hypothetical protein [Pedobacter sp.]HWW38065.1 hypothetical protein [Pedobacter sp.]
MKENFIPEELVKAFLEHVEGKSFTLPEVAVALNLDEETTVSILIYAIENKLLDVTCTWVPNKK